MGDQEQPEPQPIYLFISQSCQHSRELVQQIQSKEALAKVVQVVAVENTPKLPPGLTKVPAILVEGQIKMGNDCFDFVTNFGEIQESPTYTNSGGFEADGFSYLEGSGSGPSGTESFSFLGAQNGSEGIDSSQSESQHKQELDQRSSNSTAAVNMDAITQQRNQEVQQMQGGGGGPSGQRVF